jgi:hypothetical protein
MSKGQIARFTALAVATGTLVAAGVGPAAAADLTTTERVFDATGAGSVLRLEINLPAAVPGLLPQKIVQDIALVNGAVRSGTSPAAVGGAFIGKDGNVAVLQGLLDGRSESAMGKPGAPYALASVPDNPLGLTGGLLTAVSTAADPNADGLLASNTSSMASLQLKGAGALDSVLGPLQDALEQALGATAGTTGSGAAGGSPVAPVTDTVTEVLGTVLDTLDGVTSDATVPVTAAVRDAVDQVIAAVNALLADLTSQVATLSADDSLLDIGLIEASHTVTRTGQTVTSAASNKLVGINLLGGLIRIDGIDSSAVASLGTGVTSSDAKATLLSAKVGDLLSVDVVDQLDVLLGGKVGALLPADVLALLNTALDKVTGLLADTLGLQVVQAKTSKSASADQASASVEPASLVLDPLRSGVPLLQIGFVPAEAQVTARSITRSVITPTTLTATPTSLPRTGGSVPLALAGSVLVGVALVARRRRTAAL